MDSPRGLPFALPLTLTGPRTMQLPQVVHAVTSLRLFVGSISPFHPLCGVVAVAITISAEAVLGTRSDSGSVDADSSALARARAEVGADIVHHHHRRHHASCLADT